MENRSDNFDTRIRRACLCFFFFFFFYQRLIVSVNSLVKYVVNSFAWLSSISYGCGDLSVRLGSRIGPRRHRVEVEVHRRDAQGWRSISWVVVTFNHVGGSFNLFLAITGDVWLIPSFRIWDYVLHVEYVPCVITNCGQHQWVIPSPLSIAL